MAGFHPTASGRICPTGDTTGDGISVSLLPDAFGRISLLMAFPEPRQPTVSQLTRRDIIDYITLNRVQWNGRLDEPAFLQRIWNLSELPSTDNRFANAAGDIRQHRIAN